MHRTFSISALIVAVLIAASATAVAIYFTPLRHFTFVPPTMREVDPKTFFQLMKEHPDQYELIDVRSASIYQSAHARGAVSIPIENLFDDHYVLAQNTGKTYGLICTTGRLAAIAYGYLENWGFRNIVHIQGGMVNWSGEGLPVEGDSVSSLTSTSAAQDLHQ